MPENQEAVTEEVSVAKPKKLYVGAKRGRKSLPWTDQDAVIAAKINSNPALTLLEVAQELKLPKRKLYSLYNKAKKAGIQLRLVKRGRTAHNIERCIVCTKLRDLNKHIQAPVTIKGLAAELGVSVTIIRDHMRRLWEWKELYQSFVMCRSERLAKLIKILQVDDGMPKNLAEIGRALGYKNPAGLVANLKKRGYGNLLKGVERD